MYYSENDYTVEMPMHELHISMKDVYAKGKQITDKEKFKYILKNSILNYIDHKKYQYEAKGILEFDLEKIYSYQSDLYDKYDNYMFESSIGMKDNEFYKLCFESKEVIEKEVDKFISTLSLERYALGLLSIDLKKDDSNIIEHLSSCITFDIDSISMRIGEDIGIDDIDREYSVLKGALVYNNL